MMEKETDSEDQWQAWRIGRDCRSNGDTKEAALVRLSSTFPQAAKRKYFEAGFAGAECPELTAPNPQ